MWLTASFYRLSSRASHLETEHIATSNSQSVSRVTTAMDGDSDPTVHMEAQNKLGMTINKELHRIKRMR